MNRIVFILAFIVISLNSVFAQSSVQFVLDKKIPITGNGGYDYLKIDTSTGKLFVSHGTVVAVIDLKTEQIVATIDNMTGVHGIAVSPEFNRGFISDGKGNAVVVFDLTTFKKMKTIAISGKDPDGIMYDPFSKRVFTFNGDSKNATIIDAETMTEAGSIELGGTPEFAVSDGAGKIYNNLEDKNRVNIIDSKKGVVLTSFPLDPCGGPTGLAVDLTHQRLFTVCRKNKGMSVIDLASEKVITTVPIGAGVDAVTYDGNLGLVICSNGDGTATIIHQDDADHYSVIQTLVTEWKAKTHAFDPQTGKLYFCSFDMDSNNKNRIPDSFKVLVYKIKS